MNGKVQTAENSQNVYFLNHIALVPATQDRYFPFHTRSGSAQLSVCESPEQTFSTGATDLWLPLPLFIRFKALAGACFA